MEDELISVSQSRGDAVFTTFRKCSQRDFGEFRLVQLAEVHAIAHATVVVLTHAIVNFVADAVGI